MIGINVRNVNDAPYADWIVDGRKTIETRDSESLSPYVGKRVAIVRTGKGVAQAIGEVTIEAKAFVDNALDFDALFPYHKVTKDSTFYIKGKGKYLYVLSNAVRYSVPKPVGYGIVARKVYEE